MIFYDNFLGVLPIVIGSIIVVKLMIITSKFLS